MTTYRLTPRPDHCPRCGWRVTSFNARPWKRWDEGELFTCGGCDLSGESEDLVEGRPPECGHDEPNEYVSCPTCWWDLTHDVDEHGRVTRLW